MLSPKEEAALIVDALFDDVGATGGSAPYGEVPGVDGRDALLEMKEAGFPGWAEVEWAGYYLKFRVQKACENELPDQVKPLNLKHKRHFVKGNYVWDARLSADDKNDVVLGATDEYTDIIDTNSGIGVLVADAVVFKDETGEFKRWQEKLIGGISEYEVKREIEGRLPQPRKEAFMIRKVFAYFFTLENLKKGVKDKWAKDTWQQTMRNSNDQARGGKYLIKIDSVPREHLLFVKNFNEDAVEFNEEFPEFAD